FISTKNQNGKVTVGDLPSLLAKLKRFNGIFDEEEIRQGLGESHSDMNDEVDFEGFLRSYLEFYEKTQNHYANCARSNIRAPFRHLHGLMPSDDTPSRATHCVVGPE
ncbi:UNVERIFIED_CONTAM: Fimbrin-1, partial [Sesamum latifolium]